ncbi:glycosyltransferase [Clostridium tunisiense]|uniref:glycosyltransferase n=1 Tax=Clostridium tunisiense TaxID=219748 RepID=UPI0002DDBB21|nr:glycosyltransferase [Clostridium tunisiense]
MVSNKEKNFISAVIYVNNNEDHIGYFLENLNSVLEENFEKYEIICVNDSSTDKSIEKIREFGDKVKGPVLSVINMSFYQGMELSMNAGVDLAIGDFVYEFDSLFIDYDLNTIIDLYRVSLKGFDIVSATSSKAKGTFSELFYKVFNSTSNSTYNIQTESFRILSRRAINRVHSMSKTIPYRKVMYANCGLKFERLVYSQIRQNKPKHTKEIRDKRKELATDSLILFTDIAYKFSITMTLVMMFIAILVGFYTVFIFLKGDPVAGWTTTMLFLDFGFIGIFAVLAIIIKYLSILINLTFKMQKYTIESIEKITK